MITGRYAELRVEYQLAIRLGDWSIDYGFRTLGRFDVDVSAVVKYASPFWSRQRPFDLWTLMDNQYWWVWRGLEVTEPVVEGTRLSGITHSHPEVRRAA